VTPHSTAMTAAMQKTRIGQSAAVSAVPKRHLTAQERAGRL